VRPKQSDVRRVNKGDNVKRFLIGAAGLAIAGSMLLAPTASADNEVEVPGVGTVDTDRASYIDADGEQEGAPSQLHESLDGWAGVSPEGACADSHGSRNDPDETDEDYAADTTPDGYNCNDALILGIATLITG